MLFVFCFHYYSVADRVCYNNFYQTLLCCVQKMCVNVFEGSSSDCVVTLFGLVGGLADSVGGYSMI